MSGYRPRPYLPAVVGPMAAVVIAREFGAQLERLAEGLASSPIEANRVAGDQVRAAAASMAESARQWRERGEGGASADQKAASGRADIQDVALVSDSVSHLHGVSPPSPRPCSVEEVARRVGLSKRHVRRLCVNRELRATKEGRDWRIEWPSVEAWDESRRPVA